MNCAAACDWNGSAVRVALWVLVAATLFWPAASNAELKCDYDANGLPKNCRQVLGSSGGNNPDCDWECKDDVRRQMREHRAWKANHKGNEELNRGEFAKARAMYGEALRQIPNYSHALHNLGLVDQYERYFNYAWGREAFDSGDFVKAGEFFARSLAIPGRPDITEDIAKLTTRMEYLSRFRPAGSLMMSGAGVQTGWNAWPGDPIKTTDPTEEIRQQLALAKRVLPDGVDTKIFNVGLGVAMSTSEWQDLVLRVFENQGARGPIPPSGTSAYNSIKGKRFDLMACHSNGAMTCLFALRNDDVAARDVVLYGPQLTPLTAILWQRQLESGNIRSLRIIINTGDPVPPLAMAANWSREWRHPVRAWLFGGNELKTTISEFIPNAQVDVRQCAFNPASLFGCHRMTAYPQCKPARSTRIVAGTRNFLGQSYREPPLPGC